MDDMALIDETIAGNQYLLDGIIGQIADGLNWILAQNDELCKKCGKGVRKKADDCCKRTADALERIATTMSTSVDNSIHTVNNAYNVLVTNESIATWIVNHAPGFGEFIGIEFPGAGQRPDDGRNGPVVPGFPGVPGYPGGGSPGGSGGVGIGVGPASPLPVNGTSPPRNDVGVPGVGGPIGNDPSGPGKSVGIGIGIGGAGGDGGVGIGIGGAGGGGGGGGSGGSGGEGGVGFGGAGFGGAGGNAASDASAASASQSAAIGGAGGAGIGGAGGNATVNIANGSGPTARPGGERPATVAGGSCYPLAEAGNLLSGLYSDEYLEAYRMLSRGLGLPDPLVLRVPASLPGTSEWARTYDFGYTPQEIAELMDEKNAN